MGVTTRVYQIEDGSLAINVPSQVLPPDTLELVEEEIITPGYEAETRTTVPLVVIPHGRRIAILMTYSLGIGERQFIEEFLGLDPDKPIYIRAPRTDEWIQAHKYHWGTRTQSYGRVWYPWHLANRFGIYKYTDYPFFIRGTTLPTKEKRLIQKPVKHVILRHFGTTYSADEYAPHRWRWRIPTSLENYSILKGSINMNVSPEADCHLMEDKIINIDFIIPKVFARPVSERLGFAFRNMAVRNYTLSASILAQYPFLTELRATYLCAYPREYYQSGRKYMLLKEALKTTVYNLLEYFFEHKKNKETGEIYPHSSLSYTEHIGKIEYTTNRIHLPMKYLGLKNVPNITAAGETDTILVKEYEFYRCIKYVRVINEWCYKNRDYGRYIYSDDTINKMLFGNLNVELDESGFVWERR